MNKGKKYYLDAGTTWSKILEVTEEGLKSYSIIPSTEVKTCGLTFEKAAGHMVSALECGKDCERVNEIVALAQGVNLSASLSKPDKLVLDLGSRDAKWVKFKDSKFHDMDWNSSCASATGATIEMLLKFYGLSAGELSPQEERYNVTCGIFGFEKIMDDISGGLDPAIAVSKFVHGVAFNAFNFAKQPESLYLSGGFCENACFVESLSKYTHVTPLGRFVLVDGLTV